MMPVLTVIVITVIIDLDRPRCGTDTHQPGKHDPLTRESGEGCAIILFDRNSINRGISYQHFRLHENDAKTFVLLHSHLFINEIFS